METTVEETAGRHGHLPEWRPKYIYIYICIVCVYIYMYIQEHRGLPR